MELWSVSSLLWLIVVVLIVIGSRYLKKGFEFSRKAKLNLDIIQKTKELNILLNNIAQQGTSDQRTSNEVVDKLDKEIKELEKSGGTASTKDTDIHILRANADFALAAAFIAMASVILGGSAVLIAVFMA